MGKQMEYKTNPIWLKQVDEDQGIVEAIVAVFGNIDYQGDIIEPGAFAKTIHERGFKVRVLDNHQAMSGRDVVGKIVALRELGTAGLPSAITADHPDASGGLLATVQFLMDTPEGAGIFKRIKLGAISEYSIGYDATQAEPDVVQVAGQDITVRRLKELRLWEISPVIWAANDATRTVAAKAQDDDAEPSEGKPYIVRRRDDEYCVYKADEEGHPDGDAMQCYPDRREAEQYLQALYANVEDAGKTYTLALSEEVKDEIRALIQQELSRAQLAPADNQTEAEPNDVPPTPKAGAGPDTEPLTSDVEANVERMMLDLAVLELRALEVRDGDVS